jgi:hypothetical protein
MPHHVSLQIYEKQEIEHCDYSLRNVAPAPLPSVIRLSPVTLHPEPWASAQGGPRLNRPSNRRNLWGPSPKAKLALTWRPRPGGFEA